MDTGVEDRRLDDTQRNEIFGIKVGECRLAGSLVTQEDRIEVLLLEVGLSS